MRFSLNIAQKPLKFHGFHVLKGGAYGQGQLIIDGVKRPVFFVYHGQKHKDRVVFFIHITTIQKYGLKTSLL